MTKENGGGYGNKQKAALVAVGVILSLTVFGLGSAVLDDPWHIDPGTTIEQTGGPTVEIATTESVDTTAENPTPGEHTVDLTPDIEFYSQGDTYVRVDQIGTTADEWTELSDLDISSTDLRVDPNRSGPVTIGGTADRVQLRNISTESQPGSRADLIYAGGSLTANVTVENSSRVEAIDAETGEVLDIKLSDESGSVTVDLPSSQTDRGIDIQTGDRNPPIISDANPVDANVEDSANLSVNISDSDFDQGYTVDVTIYGNDEVLHTETLTNNSTVTTSWTDISGGRNEWTVEATDEFGDTSRESYTLHASVLLYIVDGTTTDDSLMSQTVDAELISTESGSNYREERTIENGAIRLGGVPDEQLMVRLNATEYHSRDLIITEPYGSQMRWTKMLDENNSDAFDQRFTLDSRASGFAPENTWLIAQMYLDGEWRDAAGGYFGSDNTVGVLLEDDEQYRLVVERDGDRRSLGGYTADIGFEDQVTPLIVEGVELSLDRGDTFRWEVQTEQEVNDQDELVGGDIVYKFDSGGRDVQDLEITIYNRSDPDHELTYDINDGDVGSYVASYPVPEEYLNTTWVVEWTATIDGEEQTGSESVSIKYGSTDLGLGETFTKIAAAGLLMIIAGIFGLVHAPIGAVVVAATAGLFNVLGLIDLPTLLISTVLAIAVLGFAASKTRGAP